MTIQIGYDCAWWISNHFDCFIYRYLIFLHSTAVNVHAFKLTLQKTEFTSNMTIHIGYDCDWWISNHFDCFI